MLIQSCRGTFGSGGTLDPFGPDEHDDGLATVAWLREQPWYPGAFGTAGPSYLGMVQWAIAADAGLTTAGLLHHFPSKEHLLVAVLAERDRLDGAQFQLAGFQVLA